MNLKKKSTEALRGHRSTKQPVSTMVGLPKEKLGAGRSQRLNLQQVNITEEIASSQNRPT